MTRARSGPEAPCAAADGCFDRVADVYDATRGLPETPERAVADRLHGIFAGVADPPRLFEVGVGTGRIAVPLARRGCHVTGVDLSTRMLSRLRAKGAAIEVVVGSALALPLRDACFDGALFVHVLHLVPDPAAAVRAALAGLRPGGVLVAAGEDLTRAGLWGEARGRMRETVQEVAGLALGDLARHLRALSATQETLRSAGAATETVPLTAWEGTFRARDLLDALAGRSMSWMWPIPRESLPDILATLSPRFEELLGDLDRPHPMPRSMSALVARMPA